MILSNIHYDHNRPSTATQPPDVQYVVSRLFMPLFNHPSFSSSGYMKAKPRGILAVFLAVHISYEITTPLNKLRWPPRAMNCQMVCAGGLCPTESHLKHQTISSVLLFPIWRMCVIYQSRTPAQYIQCIGLYPRFFMYLINVVSGDRAPRQSLSIYLGFRVADLLVALLCGPWNLDCFQSPQAWTRIYSLNVKSLEY